MNAAKKTALLCMALLPVLLTAACTEELDVRVVGQSLEGDTRAEGGASIIGLESFSVANVDSVEDTFGPEGARSVVLRRGRGGRGTGVTFDCVCKSGEGNVRCAEKCTISDGTAECTCSAFGCSNCAVDIGIQGQGVVFQFSQ